MFRNSELATYHLLLFAVPAILFAFKPPEILDDTAPANRAFHSAYNFFKFTIPKILEKLRKVFLPLFVLAKTSGKPAITKMGFSLMLKNLVEKILGKDYLDKAHPNALRHTRAINLLDSGMNNAIEKLFRT